MDDNEFMKISRAIQVQILFVSAEFMHITHKKIDIFNRNISLFNLFHEGTLSKKNTRFLALILKLSFYHVMFRCVLS